MFRTLQAMAAMLALLSNAAAGTVSIGTASARGDIRVDSYAVKGNATLFDGSVVETEQASADLRLGRLTDIMMSTSSKGTLFRDRLVLQKGKSEVSASGPFQVEANGLRVTPNEANSRAEISKEGNTVQVAALSGSFGVTNAQGILLANVNPGRVLSFAVQAGNAQPTSFEGEGLVDYRNGQYYLTTEANGRYLLTCKDFKKYNGTKVLISGRISGPQGTGKAQVLCVTSIAVNGASTTPWLLIGGVIIAAAAAIGYVVDRAVNQSSTPASR